MSLSMVGSSLITRDEFFNAFAHKLVNSDSSCQSKFLTKHDCSLLNSLLYKKWMYILLIISSGTSIIFPKSYSLILFPLYFTLTSIAFNIFILLSIVISTLKNEHIEINNDKFLQFVLFLIKWFTIISKNIAYLSSTVLSVSTSI